MTSITAQNIKLASEKGYVVHPDGRVTGVKGTYLKLLLRTNIREERDKLYYRFNIKDKNNKVFPIHVHRLVAYQKFGDKALQKGIHTRHLDDNSLNNALTNIEIGSASDNMLDKPEEDRKASQRRAAETRKLNNSRYEDVNPLSSYLNV